MPPARPGPDSLQAAILAWYDARGRTLPFRGTRDPYAILVSEAMAQQTQVTRAGEAWEQFIARFPSFEALASSTPADVLREWRGLGYNRRALSLWKAAVTVVADHDGRLPTDLAALERLPGIGPYTARAVAALAFGARVGAVDTNVRRVLGRVLFGQASPTLTKELQAAADEAVPADRPGDWTHALMDLGATLCKPRAPSCEACPARRWCRYAASGQAASDAAAPRTVRATRETAIPFERTTRWLRGRILDRLRDAPDGRWVGFDGDLGSHDRGAIRASLAALARDGLAEIHPDDPERARLPLA